MEMFLLPLHLANTKSGSRSTAPPHWKTTKFYNARNMVGLPFYSLLRNGNRIRIILKQSLNFYTILLISVTLAGGLGDGIKHARTAQQASSTANKVKAGI